MWWGWEVWKGPFSGEEGGEGGRGGSVGAFGWDPGAAQESHQKVVKPQHRPCGQGPIGRNPGWWARLS